MLDGRAFAAREEEEERTRLYGAMIRKGNFVKIEMIQTRNWLWKGELKLYNLLLMIIY